MIIIFIIITIQAQYWHDPLAEEEYAANSVFLSDINNQGFCLLKISTTLILIIIYTGFDLNVALIIFTFALLRNHFRAGEELKLCRESFTPIISG